MKNQEKIALEQIKDEYPDWQKLSGSFIRDEIAVRVWWLNHQDYGRIWTNLKCGDCGSRIVGGQFANICGDCYAKSFFSKRK